MTLKTVMTAIKLAVLETIVKHTANSSICALYGTLNIGINITRQNFPIFPSNSTSSLLIGTILYTNLSVHTMNSDPL